MSMGTQFRYHVLSRHKTTHSKHRKLSAAKREATRLTRVEKTDVEIYDTSKPLTHENLIQVEYNPRRRKRRKQSSLFGGIFG